MEQDAAVIRRAVTEGYADAGVLVDLEESVRRAMWFPEYLPIRYEPWAGAERPVVATAPERVVETVPEEKALLVRH